MATAPRWYFMTGNGHCGAGPDEVRCGDASVWADAFG
jgi:hypothetical protein